MSDYEKIGASYEAVRMELLNMQDISGSMIKPFGLYKVIEYIIGEEGRTKMTKVRIRDIADTFCALCNEFYLFNCQATEPKREFYISESRWEKYYLGQKAIENSLKFLQDYGLIHCTKKRNPYKGINKVRMYSIDMDKLIIWRRCCEELYAKKEKKKYF